MKRCTPASSVQSCGILEDWVDGWLETSFDKTTGSWLPTLNYALIKEKAHRSLQITSNPWMSVRSVQRVHKDSLLQDPLSFLYTAAMPRVQFHGFLTLWDPGISPTRARLLTISFASHQCPFLCFYSSSSQPVLSNYQGCRCLRWLEKSLHWKRQPRLEGFRR